MPLAPVTAPHVDAEYLLFRSPKPYLVRSTRSLGSTNCSSDWYSTCTTSGAPEPALIAFCSLVLLSPAPPVSTRFTLTFGYACSKAATCALADGVHVQ